MKKLTVLTLLICANHHLYAQAPQLNHQEMIYSKMNKNFEKFSEQFKNVVEVDFKSNQFENNSKTGRIGIGHSTSELFGVNRTALRYTAYDLDGELLDLDSNKDADACGFLTRNKIRDVIRDISKYEPNVHSLSQISLASINIAVVQTDDKKAKPQLSIEETKPISVTSVYPVSKTAEVFFLPNGRKQPLGVDSSQFVYKQAHWDQTELKDREFIELAGEKHYKYHLTKHKVYDLKRSTVLNIQIPMLADGTCKNSVQDQDIIEELSGFYPQYTKHVLDYETRQQKWEKYLEKVADERRRFWKELESSPSHKPSEEISQKTSQR
ncbi:MAG: hypothetical protein VX341_09015 [Bdellovibrionota bacterium]|nr:hypothetical protein [Bdellovibrionota bacterium]